ncbi:MAG TPA: hypothetical protein VFP49_02905 [Nitrososphaeraceae archaeon]|nr:hypothetical protein [Nitrososphaeraceae archaeon]
MNFAVNAAILPDSNCTALFTSLYSASPLIFVTVVLFSIIGFIPVLASSIVVVYP